MPGLLAYDYDEFIGRLRAHGCSAERTAVAQRADGRSVEVFVIGWRGRERTLQIGPGDMPLARSTVESIVSGLGLPHGPFEL